MQKVKNIIIFVVIGGIMFSLYLVFLKPDAAPEDNLISTPGSPIAGGGVGALSVPGGTIPVAENFLNLLLNVKNIRLEDSVLSDPSFKALHDSSIELTHDGSEGRINPFAKLGTDQEPVPVEDTVTNVDGTIPDEAGAGAPGAESGADSSADGTEALEDFLNDLELQ